MSEAIVRARIKAVLEAVSGIGTVHDYRRWFINDEGLHTLYTTSSVLNAWIISLINYTQEYLDYGEDAGQKRLVLRTYTYRIECIYALKDSSATEKTVAAIAEDVGEALDGNDDLHDETNYYNKTPPCQLDVFEHILFMGKLCHHVQFSLKVAETVVIAANQL